MQHDPSTRDKLVTTAARLFRQGSPSPARLVPDFGPLARAPEAERRRDEASPRLAMSFLANLLAPSYITPREVGAGRRLANPVRSGRKQP